MSPSAADALLDQVFRTIVKPFVFGMGGGADAIPRPREALDALDRIEDFALAGADITDSEALKEHADLLEMLLRPEDRIEKQGRRLFFHLETPRRIDWPGLPLKGSIEESFHLEFRLEDQPFDDPEVDQRKQKALDAAARDLGEGASEEVLIVGVLPQTKRWTGVYTPLGVELGLRLSLRFLIAFFFGDRIRLFAAGPMVKEIPL
jgi:hypothetical protein